MSYQNAYQGIQGNQMNKQSRHLIQYNSNVSPSDPLGLQGMKYTILESTNNSQIYNQQIQDNMNYGIQMNQNQRNTAPSRQQNIQNKIVHQQTYMKQNIPSQYQQLLQPQLIQQQQMNPQYQPNYQNQKVQMPPGGYPSQDPSKKIQIPYNKKDEHFVNRPIYPIRKSPSYPLTIQPTLNQQKQIKNITNNQKLDKGNKNENNKINSNPKASLKQSGGGISGSKISDKKLSMIQEIENEKDKKNDKDIKKSGLTLQKSQMSNKTNKLKESQIEKKNNPGTVLSDNITENDSQNNIIQKSISQSVNPDFDANLSHLPTIFSIMRGNSQPLPPMKINKYGK
jgi:hypothetical protein